METDPETPGASEGADRPEPGGASHDYSYGEAPLTADGTAEEIAREAAPSAPSTRSTPDSALDPGTDGAEAPPTETRLTTPRAVLRPVPEGFPTPPPRPARPNRRPAPPSEEQTPAPRSRRGVLLGGIALAVVLLLAAAVGGGVLAYRALAPGEAGPAATSPAAADESAAEVQIGEVTVRELGVERGVRSVGSGTSALEPEGEFVIVTLEIVNDSAASLSGWQGITLETADGETFPADAAAGRAHIAETTSYGVLPSGEAQSVHLVYDVPVGAEPTALQIDFSSSGGETGSLPLSS